MSYGPEYDDGLCGLTEGYDYSFSRDHRHHRSSSSSSFHQQDIIYTALHAVEPTQGWNGINIVGQVLDKSLFIDSQTGKQRRSFHIVDIYPSHNRTRKIPSLIARVTVSVSSQAEWFPDLSRGDIIALHNVTTFKPSKSSGNAFDCPHCFSFFASSTCLINPSVFQKLDDQQILGRLPLNFTLIKNLKEPTSKGTLYDMYSIAGWVVSIGDLEHPTERRVSHKRQLVLVDESRNQINCSLFGPLACDFVCCTGDIVAIVRCTITSDYPSSGYTNNRMDDLSSSQGGGISIRAYSDKSICSVIFRAEDADDESGSAQQRVSALSQEDRNIRSRRYIGKIYSKDLIDKITALSRIRNRINSRERFSSKSTSSVRPSMGSIPILSDLDSLAFVYPLPEESSQSSFSRIIDSVLLLSVNARGFVAFRCSHADPNYCGKAVRMTQESEYQVVPQCSSNGGVVSPPHLCLTPDIKISLSVMVKHPHSEQIHQLGLSWDYVYSQILREGERTGQYPITSEVFLAIDMPTKEKILSLVLPFDVPVRIYTSTRIVSDQTSSKSIRYHTIDKIVPMEV